MGIPIIFVHKGDSFYLNFSLSQAHLSNPGSPVYLITDTPTPKFDFVQYVNIGDYHKEADRFASVYRHMSTNDYNNELFCFQRWFVIREFCAKNNITCFLYTDSDILLYCKVDEVFPKMNSYTFTVSKKLGPQCCYFPSAEKLDDFCSFMMKLYTDPVYTQRLEKKHRHHLDNQLPGGVCDMTVFYEYQLDHPAAAKDLFAIENGETFDDNFNESDGFVMDGKTKKIEMQNGFPYGILQKNGQKIKFNTLHFQGVAKRYIFRYYTGNDLKPLKRKLANDLFLMEHYFLFRVARRLGYKLL